MDTKINAFKDATKKFRNYLPNKNDRFITRAVKFLQRNVVILNRGFNQSIYKLINSILTIDKENTLPFISFYERDVRILNSRIDSTENYIQKSLIPSPPENENNNNTEDNIAVNSYPHENIEPTKHDIPTNEPLLNPSNKKA